MQFTCDQQELSRGLSTVCRAVSGRTTHSILSNVVLATDQGRLKLSATNLEIGINCWVDAEVQEEGVVAVPAKTFAELVSNFTQGRIDISVSSHTFTVKLKNSSSNATIRGVDASEFPFIPEAEGGIELGATLLKEMIAQSAFAVTDDESRPVFTGVLFEAANGLITAAATDSFRLALKTSPLQNESEMQSQLLIPARALSELARILPSDGTVRMAVNRSQVLFHAGQMEFASRLIEGVFPNIRSAIPQQYTTRVVVDTKELAAAVKCVSPFARISANVVRVRITGEFLVLESNAEDVGDNMVTVKANVDGPDLQIIFNVRYLSEVLAVLTSPEVSLEFNAARNPCVVRPVGNTDYTYVIVPMSPKGM